jgi:hypothetical protein
MRHHAILFASIAVLVSVFILSGCGSPATNNTVVPSINRNTNTTGNNNSNTNENINGTGIVSPTEAVYIGMVSLKGYKTPSESYGLFTDDSTEIGLGQYDSMKEQFRAYIGDKVKVRFSNICRSSHEDCCRSLFPYCGTVKSWEPLNLNINQ